MRAYQRIQRTYPCAPAPTGSTHHWRPAERRATKDDPVLGIRAGDDVAGIYEGSTTCGAAAGPSVRLSEDPREATCLRCRLLLAAGSVETRRAPSLSELERRIAK